MSVTDITKRRPFQCDEKTTAIVELLREIADEVERGEYGQMECLATLMVNEQHTYISRLPSCKCWDAMWESVAVRFIEQIKKEENPCP